MEAAANWPSGRPPFFDNLPFAVGPSQPDTLLHRVVRP